MAKYTIPFEGILTAAAQDMVALKAAAGVPFRVLRYWVNAVDTALPTSQMLQLRARLLPSVVTLGSGGSVVTPAKIGSQGDAAPQTTAHINDTVKATSSGTAVITDEEGCHIYNGYDSAIQGRDPLTIAAAAGFVWELLSAPLGTVHLSGGVDIEELT